MCFDKEYVSVKPNLLDALKIPKCHSFYNIFCFGSRIENAPKKGEIDVKDCCKQPKRAILLVFGTYLMTMPPDSVWSKEFDHLCGWVNIT